MPLPLLPLLPLLPVYLTSARFRLVWHRVYHQQEQAIRSLAIPDVSDYDLLLLGTPKWLYLSFPVARWLNTVRGRKASGRRLSRSSAARRSRSSRWKCCSSRWNRACAHAARRSSTAWRYRAITPPYFFVGEMERLFRFVSRMAFKRPPIDFTLDGEVGKIEVQRFCDAVFPK